MPGKPRESFALATTAALSLFAAACGDGTGPGTHQDAVQYLFQLEAFGVDSTSERIRNYECFVFGFFEVPLPVPQTGTARFSVAIQRHFVERRGAHMEDTRADSVVGDATLQFSGLGGSEIQVGFTAGPYVVDLGTGLLTSVPAQEYRGDWTCGPALPLARDSTLLAYGYDPALELTGTWRVSQEQPVEGLRARR